MADPRPNRIPLPPKRVFGIDDSALDVDDFTPSSLVYQQPRRTSRVSVGRLSLPRKPSFITRWSANQDEEIGPSLTLPSERPPIPSALAQATEVSATPLPVLSMIVLSITMLGEFLSANVSASFLLFMVEGFSEFRGEVDVGFWTGILASSFFLTQFLTSLLWATVADKHGERAVLFISLLGSAITCFLFGTSTSMRQAVVTRLLQGIFAGAIGVARGAITVVTDQSNEGRAYAIMGFCWGLGGVAGSIIGATFESPAKKWPGWFSEIAFFVDYPYALPCAVASSITLVGAILSLFLGPDGGPREGIIRLSDKETGNQRPSPIMEDVFTTVEDPETRRFDSLGRRMSNKLSGYFARRAVDTSTDSPILTNSPSLSVPLSLARGRTPSRTSKANGSAYGYSGSYRNRLGSTNTFGTRRGSLAMSIRRRRGSNTVDAPQSSVGDNGELNFAQRLLMANENAVTNISDLWVSAAMNVDNEDPFESDSDLDVEPEQGAEENRDEAQIGSPFPSTPARAGSRQFSGLSSPRPSTSTFRQVLAESPRRPSNSRRSSAQHFPATSAPPGDDLPSARRFSSNAIPTIFSHAGVRTPPAVLEAQQLLSQPEDIIVGPSLQPIMESQPVLHSEKSPSLYSLLPVMIIVHYGLLALHSTTHDQVFYLYLVSKYKSGGLNLNAGHFGQLIALMCFCQIAYQFYLYPNIGPPRGRFSHLAMFRLGSILFIPAYLSVILYRAFASSEGDGDFILMTALALSTAIRYCGATFAYTAISVLLNYMSPPHVVGFANGIAQSIVSFSRFLGPIVGGTLWSMSVEHDPKGYPLGFLVCAGVCTLAVLHSFLIR